MKLVPMMLMAVIASQNCAATAPASNEKSESVLEKEGATALANGDYARAVELAMPRARAGDPEYQFTIGWVLFRWIEDPHPKMRPQYTAKDALDWIYKAAHAGVPQAISTLREGYQWGRFSLPKNAELAACWRKIERGEQEAEICFAAERNLSR